MQIIHDFAGISVAKETNDNASFLLTNNKGSFANFAVEQDSRYRGFFFFDDKSKNLLKFIENIELKNEGKAEILKNNGYFFERKKGGMQESFIMPKKFNSILYELDDEGRIDLILDCKRIFDSREWGRNYEILSGKKCIVVKFTKKTDEKEDKTHNRKEFSLYLAIKSNSNKFKENDLWTEKSYLLDEKRSSPPFKRFVYNALELQGKRFVFTISKSPNKAIKECNHLFSNLNKMKKKEKLSFDNFLKNKKIKRILNNSNASNEIKAAYICALNSLNRLYIDKLGLIAGLPWFHDVWSRDCIVSLKAFSNINPKICDKIIFNYISNIRKDGRIRKIEGVKDNLDSADSIGWLFLRFNEPIDKKKKTNLAMKNSLEKSLKGLLRFHTVEGFEFSNPKETWMDTDFGDNSRAGARIEMQALRLNMYRILFELTLDKKYLIMENILRSSTRKNFWNGSVLADGLNDFTIRPNIFVAFYAYPDLLDKIEWEKCFENSLGALWLEWGGLSSIDKSSQLFCNDHTGENPRSYHRGDSWFWINNLAALCLHKINKEKFKDKIEKIISASTEEILWKGCIGCHSELSSAKNLSSEGCFTQTWSNAMFVEMIDRCQPGSDTSKSASQFFCQILLNNQAKF